MRQNDHSVFLLGSCTICASAIETLSVTERFVCVFSRVNVGPPKFEVGVRVIGKRPDELWYPGKVFDTPGSTFIIFGVLFLWRDKVLCIVVLLDAFV